MKRAIFLIVLCLLLASCARDLPPEPAAPGSLKEVTGSATVGTGDTSPFSEPDTVTLSAETVNFGPLDTEKTLKLAVEGEQYVYKYGYVLDISTYSWKQFTFNEDTVLSSNWIAGKATADIVLTLNSAGLADIGDVSTLYAITYACTKVDNVWSCHANKWMLSSFTAKKSACGDSDDSKDYGGLSTLEGGTDIYIPGRATSVITETGICVDENCGTTAADYCIDVNTYDILTDTGCDSSYVGCGVAEAFCYSIDQKIGEIGNANIECPYGCVDGACLAAATEPSVLWLTEGFPFYPDFAQSTPITVLDVTENELSCNIQIDDVAHWLDKGQSAEWNNIKVTVMDVRAVHAQLLDVDVCQLKLEPSTNVNYLGPLVGYDVIREGNTITAGTNVFNVLDINEDATVCGISSSDGAEVWLRERQSLVSDGIGISVIKAYAVHSQKRDNDECVFSVYSSTDASTSSPGIPLRQYKSSNDDHLLSSDPTVITKLIDVSDSEKKCGIDIDGETRWLDVGSSSSWNGLKIDVVDAYAVHTELQDRDVCLIKATDTAETTTYDHNYIKQDVPFNTIVGGVEHAVKMTDITEAEDACMISVDDTLAIIAVGDTKTINGVQVGVYGAIAVHAQLQNEDLCDIKIF